MELIYYYLGVSFFWTIVVLLGIVVLLLIRKWTICLYTIIFPSKSKRVINWQFWRAINGTQMTINSLGIIDKNDIDKKEAVKHLKEARRNIRVAYNLYNKHTVHGKVTPTEEQ